MSVCPAGHTSTADDYCDVCGMPIEATTTPGAPPPAPDVPADAAAGAGGSGAAQGQPCPNCGTPNAAEALFCENCGYDFTTGSLPRPAAPENPLDVGNGSDAGGAPGAAPDAGATGPDAAAGADPGNASSVPAGADTVVAPAADSPADRAGPAAAPFDWVVEMWIDPAWYEAQDSPDPLPSPGLPEVLPLRSASVLVGRRSVSRNINPEIDCGDDSGVSRRQAQLTTDGRRWFVEDLDSANGTFVGSASGALPSDPIAVGTKCELDADDRIYVGAWTRLVIREATEDELASLG